MENSHSQSFKVWMSVQNIIKFQLFFLAFQMTARLGCPKIVIRLLRHLIPSDLAAWASQPIQQWLCFFLQVGRSQIFLISPDTKKVSIEKSFREISFCSQVGEICLIYFDLCDVVKDFSFAFKFTEVKHFFTGYPPRRPLWLHLQRDGGEGKLSFCVLCLSVHWRITGESQKPRWRFAVRPRFHKTLRNPKIVFTRQSMNRLPLFQFKGLLTPGGRQILHSFFFFFKGKITATLHSHSDFVQRKICFPADIFSPVC